MCRGKARGTRFKEQVFHMLMGASGYLIVFLLVAIFFTLLKEALPAIKHNGFDFLWSTLWNPETDRYGVFVFFVGTFLTSFIALIMSIPFALAISILVSEYLVEYRSGKVIAEFMRHAIDLLAGVPSVIYGFWGLFFIVPIVQYFERLFKLPSYGVGILCASIVLAIMILPYSASIVREVIAMVPIELKEAAYALAATKYETVKRVVIRHSLSGIMAGVILALGRAIGETMAVTMLIGNSNKICTNVLHLIFNPGNTMASVIANEFAEATGKLYLSSLMEIGLLLFVISFVLNIVGKRVVRRFAL